jgi:hypothetical protein
MKRKQTNLSGEAMQGGKTLGTANVLRRIRRRASRMGLTLGNFRQIYGLESDLGPEYTASSIRHPGLAVLVWHPIGDVEIEEAVRTCDEIIVAERYKSSGRPSIVYGVSWIGRWPHKENNMLTCFPWGR